MPGTLFVVATPIGNLEDVTARALRVLGEVALIAAEDTRRTAKLLTRYGIRTPATSLHEHNERQKTTGLIERLVAGESIAIVSDAGTPTVSDPGTHLVRTAFERGIPVVPIPGPSAVTALLSVSGFPSSGFHFLGFPPTRSKDRIEWFERLRAAVPIAVFYESPHRIASTLNEIQRRIGDAVIVVGRELTKAHEELVKGPISEVLERIQARGEFVVAIEIGQVTEIVEAQAPTDLSVASEFWHLTKSGLLTRRQAIASLSRKYGKTAREVYSAVESSKNSVG
jgi:16S rRNA (cytidine1402-2'-O)-methyltransferase